jgi:hypothetical protein
MCSPRWKVEGGGRISQRKVADDGATLLPNDGDTLVVNCDGEPAYGYGSSSWFPWTHRLAPRTLLARVSVGGLAAEHDGKVRRHSSSPVIEEAAGCAWIILEKLLVVPALPNGVPARRNGDNTAEATMADG